VGPKKTAKKKPASSKTRAGKKPREPEARPPDQTPRAQRAPVDVEVEVKLPCDGIETLNEAGLALETIKERHFEDNWVYKLPDGKVHKGQYLRVRYVGNGNGSGARRAGVLTYKGKSKRTSDAAKGKHKGKKVREEIESSVGQPNKVVKIFKRIGLKRSFRYQKYRSIFRVNLEDGRSLLAMFDETPIGNFIELEGESTSINAVAERLGYPQSAFISESYVEMQFARCAAKGEPLTDMVFPADEGRAARAKRKKAARPEKRRK